MKHSDIGIKLSQYLTTNYVIQPSFATPLFFEYQFKNPYSEDHCFTIIINDPECICVTDINECYYFKRILSLNTPTEKDLIIQGNKIIMRANETVYVPFKFQSFNCGEIQRNLISSEVTSTFGDILPDEPIKERTIPISFINQQSVTVCILKVKVEPLPFSVDKTFHFYNSENDFMKKNIRITPLYNSTNSSSSKLYIYCSSKQVIATSSPPSQKHNDLIEVSIKYRCGPAPQIARFYIIVFEDSYRCKISHIWQLFVHSVQRLDITGVVGQTTKAPLILRGSNTTHIIQCFSSNPQELKTYPSTPFSSVAGALNEVTLSLKPNNSGYQQYYINVVDIEYHKLISAWIIAASVSDAIVTQEFQLSVSTVKGSSKKITYTNPYSNKKFFLVSTNKFSLLQFKENTKFELGGFESIQIPVLFKPIHNKGQSSKQTTILVFINDAELDKTEECIKFLIEYIT